MKISELINQLTHLEKQHGDLPVWHLTEENQRVNQLDKVYWVEAHKSQNWQQYPNEVPEHIQLAIGN